MKELSPRGRVLAIAGMTLALSVIMLLQGVALAATNRAASGSLLRLALGEALFGAVVGLIFGVVMVEAPRRLNRLGEHQATQRAMQVIIPLVAMALMMAVLQSRSMGLFNTLMFWGWAIPVGVGVGLMAAGKTSRRGDSRHCPKCEYEFGFHPDDPQAPIRCTECGTPWLGRLLVGRREGSRRLMGWGVGVLTATALVIVLFFSGVGLVKMAPTGVLLTWLGGAPTFGAGDAWAELATRTITSEQRAGLASRLLDRRWAKQFSLGVGAKEWLDAEIGAGTLPAEVRERFFAEMFRGELDVPRWVRVGEPFEVGFRRTTSADGFLYKCFVYVGGFAVGEGAPTIGRRDEGFYPNLIDRARPTPYSEVSAALTADELGVATVRADVWLMVQTGFPATITWNDDGTPVVPPSALWVKRMEMSAEVEVAP